MLFKISNLKREIIALVNPQPGHEKWKYFFIGQFILIPKKIGIRNMSKKRKRVINLLLFLVN